MDDLCGSLNSTVERLAQQKHLLGSVITSYSSLSQILSNSLVNKTWASATRSFLLEKLPNALPTEFRVCEVSLPQTIHTI
jgi:hypothetical protein